ncbi:MAG: ATP-binding protein [Elusimicrobia bacterium]|nr:ATP-binding protein [Elusimicrobiota bacterium]
MPAALPRLLAPPGRSFFLFGPRATGKSTWLRSVLPDARRLDLLDTRLALELTRSPHLLESHLGGLKEGDWAVVDEVQKVPALLDEVHRLMEDRRLRFALCGSSARKLKRGGANLLGGRALLRRMEGFTAVELGTEYDLERALRWGTLPIVQSSLGEEAAILESYVHSYIQEEIKAEGIVRQVPPFLRFLSVAGLLNGQAVNASNVSREAAVPRVSVDAYFEILVDTLFGHFLPAWQPGLKVRERARPKFYWFDPGVARAAAGLLADPVDRAWVGFALETLIFHELRVFNEASGSRRPLSHYRTAAGVEIDFIVETRRRSGDAKAGVVCIEVKSAERWDRAWERPMRELAASAGVGSADLIGVYRGDRRLRFDAVQVLPVQDFLTALHRGELF